MTNLVAHIYAAFSITPQTESRGAICPTGHIPHTLPPDDLFSATLLSVNQLWVSVVFVPISSFIPSHMTTHSVVSDPRLLVATHLYFPESAGIEFMISMVMTPSVCVIGYLSVSSSFPPLNHLICKTTDAHFSSHDDVAVESTNLAYN